MATSIFSLQRITCCPCYNELTFKTLNGSHLFIFSTKNKYFSIRKWTEILIQKMADIQL